MKIDPSIVSVLEDQAEADHISQELLQNFFLN